MRRIRPLLLLAIFGILLAVGASYYLQRNFQQSQAPPAPKSLPPNTSAAAKDWVWSKAVGSRPVVEVRAASFRQVKEPSRFDLERVELHLFNKNGTTFDRVKSARAQFDTETGILYSDGDVEITMGVPAEGSPPGRLVLIRTSGVTYDSKTGRASTDREAAFTFDRGSGRAIGASYDPNSRELHMRSQAEVIWEGRGPKPRPIKVEAGELTYKEGDSVIFLSPWSRLTRESTVVEGGPAIVWLAKGAIDRVEAKPAHGSSRQPGRLVEYSADALSMTFSDHSEIERISARPNATLTSTSATTKTTVTADDLEMQFEAGANDSELKQAWARGHGVIEIKPLVSKNDKTPETRVVRSDVIELEMKPGGRDIESVKAHMPGSVDFIPNSPGQVRRRLDADRLSLTYGPGNQIQSFLATNVSTRSTPQAPAGKQPPPPSVTSSKGLLAHFDPGSGELVRMEQWEDFRYEEGDRKGRAEKAVLEEQARQITLEGKARLWDPTGFISADKIVLDQKTGDISAQAHVASTREADSQRKASAMLSEDEPMHAKADRMTTRDNKGVVRYEGNAVVWQGGERIEAGWIEIDRKQRRLSAGGNVTSQFVEQPDPKAPVQKKQSPVFTIIRAPEMSYDDETRVAHYRGGVTLTRPETQVKSLELRAWLEEKNSGSQLEKALADGNVEIVHSSPERTRKGMADHAEYYAAEGKVILYGGRPVFEDSLRGSTSGSRLTWFANSDRLLVDGRENQPTVSRIIRN